MFQLLLCVIVLFNKHSNLTELYFHHFVVLQYKLIEREKTIDVSDIDLDINKPFALRFIDKVSNLRGLEIAVSQRFFR